MNGGYIHEDPKHVQEGRVMGTAVDRNSNHCSFSGSYDVFLPLRLAISGDYDFLAIGLAEPRICRQLGHSAMLVGPLRSERHVSSRHSVSYEPKRNLSAAKTLVKGGSLMGALFRHSPMQPVQPVHSLCNPSAGKFRLGLSRQKCLVRLVRPTQADTETSGQLGIYSHSLTTSSLLTWP